jgi:hypothetical protein
MRLVGDPDGIVALKELVAQHRDYLKFLITEAQSATNHAAGFRSGDGTRWELRLRLDTGDMEVHRVDPAP